MRWSRVHAIEEGAVLPDLICQEAGGAVSQVFQSKTHQEVCTALGKGILALMDQDSGTFYHVLNGCFTRTINVSTIRWGFCMYMAYSG